MDSCSSVRRTIIEYQVAHHVENKSEWAAVKAIQAIRAANPTLSYAWPIRVGDVYIDVYTHAPDWDGARSAGNNYSSVKIDSILITRVSPPRAGQSPEPSWGDNCTADYLVLSKRATATCNGFMNDAVIYKSTAWILLHRCP